MRGRPATNRVGTRAAALSFTGHDPAQQCDERVYVRVTDFFGRHDTNAVGERSVVSDILSHRRRVGLVPSGIGVLLPVDGERVIVSGALPRALQRQGRFGAVRRGRWRCGIRRSEPRSTTWPHPPPRPKNGRNTASAPTLARTGRCHWRQCAPPQPLCMVQSIHGAPLEVFPR